MKTIEDREIEFRDSLNPFEKQYGADMLYDFYMYWTEPNKSRTKMKFELEKTWDTKRRLITWNRNSSRFGG